MFGQGRNAWYVLRTTYGTTRLSFANGTASLCSPGRFFAINEVKAIVTHILLNHDLKLPGDVREPEPGFWFAGQRAPSHGASIIFRKRRS